MGTKYTISYNSHAGDAIQVAFQFSGYAGAATVLTGGPSPVVIEHEFNIKEFPAEPVTDTKMTINISLPTFAGNFYEDITDVQDGDCWVVYHNLTQNIKQSGWLIPDESHRKFNTYNYDISLTVISPLSFMKNKTLLADDGKMLYDKHSIGALITTCLKRSLPAHIAPVYNINAVLNDNSGGSFTGSLLRVEGFNSSDGRPPSCYDVLKAIASSFACKLTWLNDVLHIENLHHLAGLAADRSIVIKAFETDDFLIGNTEDVTKVRGVGELSTKYNYAYNVGILKNGLFTDYAGGSFTHWSIANVAAFGTAPALTYTGGYITQSGSGRKIDRYAARIQGDRDIAAISKTETTHNRGLYNSATVRMNDTLNIKLELKFFDYKHRYSIATVPTAQYPKFVFFVVLKPTGATNFDDYYFFYGQKTMPDTTYVYTSMGPNYKGEWIKASDFKVGGMPTIMPCTIELDSLDNIQKAEFTTGLVPVAGQVFCMLMGLRTLGSLFTVEADKYIDVLSVIISAISQTEGTKVTGEEHYITNNTSFKPAEQKELKLANFFNEGVAGSLMNAAGVSTSGYNGMMLQKLVLMQLMALSRSPRYAADIDVKSRGLKPTDLLELHEGLNSLLPDKYLITRMVTNTKTCEHNLQVYQLKAEDKGTTADADPSAMVDLYEYFKTQQEA